MFDLFETIEQTIREILINFISGNLNSMFTDVNERTVGIAGEVSQTPQQWNPGIFPMIQALSENVMIPIAGMIIAFVLCYELITMITEKNNMQDMDINSVEMVFQSDGSCISGKQCIYHCYGSI